MRLLRNSGADRALDLLRDWLAPNAGVDIVSPTFSLLAFAEIRSALDRIDRCRLVLGESSSVALSLLGSEADIGFRGRLPFGHFQDQIVTQNLAHRTVFRRRFGFTPTIDLARDGQFPS